MARAGVILCAAACVDAKQSTAAVRTPIELAASATEYGFLLQNERGDTVAIERVRRRATWREVQLRLPRSGEQFRFVLQHANDSTLARWDVTRERERAGVAPRAPERWRVHVTPESLFVMQGAVIGAPFTLHVRAVTQAAWPWHNASPALMEAMISHASRNTSLRATTALGMAVAAQSGLTHTVRMERLRGDSLLLRHPEGDWRLAVNQDGQLLGGVAEGSRVRLSRIVLPTGLRSTDGLPTRSASTSAPYDAEEVVLTASDGVPLAGTFIRPRGSMQAPAVLLVSGAGPQNRDLAVPGLPDYHLFAALADTLVRRGVAVLRLDDRGTGRSGGAAYSATTIDEVDDVRTALRWLRHRRDLRGDRIALVGHSDGGLTVLHAGEASADTHRRSRPQPLDTAIRALVAIGAPSRSGRELARAQRQSFVAADSALFAPSQRQRILEQLEAETERVARVDPWLRSWLDHDPRTVAWQSSVAVLLVHGERDQQVPVSHVDELAALLRRGRAREVQTLRLPAVNHLLIADSSGDPRRYRTLPSRAVSAHTLGPIVEWIVTRLE